MRVYGYVRVSTKGQAPGTSLDEQTAEILEKYPTAVIVREVASGASERPEFAKICEQLETGDTLVVCKLDRFCRTAKEGLGYVDYLRGKGAAVHILNMGVIDNSPMGRLMVTMLLAFAEFERSLMPERLPPRPPATARASRLLPALSATRPRPRKLPRWGMISLTVIAAAAT